MQKMIEFYHKKRHCYVETGMHVSQFSESLLTQIDKSGVLASFEDDKDLCEKIKEGMMVVHQ